jgi:predicted RNase H-like nuclease (RuvC/YqgF family)
MLDSSLESTNFWFNFFNGMLLLGAILVAVGTAGAIKTAATKERYADERIASNEAATQRAKADAILATHETTKSNERIAELEVRAGELRKASEEARQHAAQAELDLERLRQRISQGFSMSEYLRSYLQTGPSLRSSCTIWRTMRRRFRSRSQYTAA